MHFRTSISFRRPHDESATVENSLSDFKLVVFTRHINNRCSHIEQKHKLVKHFFQACAESVLVYLDLVFDGFCGIMWDICGTRLACSPFMPWKFCTEQNEKKNQKANLRLNREIIQMVRKYNRMKKRGTNRHFSNLKYCFLRYSMQAKKFYSSNVVAQLLKTNPSKFWCHLSCKNKKNYWMQ